MSNTTSDFEKLLNKINIHRIEELGRSGRSIIFRGVCHSLNVAVKVPLNFKNSPEDTWIEYSREATTLARMKHHGLPTIYAVGKIDEVPYLVKKLVEGTTLSKTLTVGFLAENKLIDIAKSLAETLAELHRFSLLHRDIKPSNVIIDKQWVPHLIDFGFTIRSNNNDSSDEYKGTIQYSSPEQLRIIQRPIDERADLYSLGIMLYECATGKLPYIANEASSLIKMHSTLKPDPIANIRADFSEVLEKIIMKLIAKNPDDRYQSANSLLFDINNIVNLSVAVGQGRKVSLGESNGRLYGQKDDLVGRQIEKNRVIDVWTKTQNQGGQILLISGEAGTGKTRLVNELIDKVTPRVQYVRTKCRQGMQSPLDAIKGLMVSLLKMVEARWVNNRVYIDAKIASAASDLEAILIEFLPEFKVLLPKVPVKSTSTPTYQTQDHLCHALCQFIIKLCNQLGPTVIFVDDLQWLDEASANFIRMLSEKIHQTRILLLMTSRHNIDAFDPRSNLGRALERVSENIALSPLKMEEVRYMLERILGNNSIQPSIIETVFQRTQGNPLSVAEYVQSMLDEAIILPFWGDWKLEENRLRKVNLPDTLVDLMEKKVRSLSKDTQNVLSTLAFLDISIPLEKISEICELTLPAVEQALNDAKKENLIEQNKSIISFTHDKIQESVAAILPLAQKQALHQKIAEVINKISEQSSNKFLTFSVAHHFFEGEKSKTPAMAYIKNLEAADMAIKKCAGVEAHKFLLQAKAFAEIAKFEPDQKFYTLLGHSCVMTGQLHDAVNYFERAINLEKSPLKRAQIRTQLARAYISIREIGKTWDQILKTFEEIGYLQSSSKFVHFLRTVRDLLKYFFKFKVFRSSKTVDENLREHLCTLVQCYEVSIQAAYFRSDLAFLLYGLQSIYPSGKLGISKELSFAYSLAGLNFALIRLSRLAEHFSKKGIFVANQTSDISAIARAEVWNAIILNFDGQWPEAEKVMSAIIEQKKDLIDTTDYFNLLGCYMFQLIIQGRPNDCWNIINHAKNWLWSRQSKTDVIEFHPYFSYQLIALPLVGREKECLNFLHGCSEAVEKTPEDRFGRALYYSCLLAFYYETGELGKVVDITAEKYKEADKNHPSLNTLHTKHFYSYFAYVVLYRNIFKKAGDDEIDYSDLKLAYRELKNTSRIPNCPALTSHALIIESAIYFFDGKTEKSLSILTQAEDIAIKHRLTLARFEALRLRAWILKLTDRDQYSIITAKEAFHLAHENGWFHRRNWLVKEFSIHINLGEIERHKDSETKVDLIQQRHATALLKVSNALGSSSEPVERIKLAMDELINAVGAERAFFMLMDDQKEVASLIGRRYDKTEIFGDKTISLTIIEKVKSTKKAIILSKRTDDLSISESIRVYDLKSIIAVPMLIENHLEGIIYLDNNSLRETFKLSDVELVQSIANQITLFRRSSEIALKSAESRNLKANLNRFLPTNVVNEIMNGTIKIEGEPRTMDVTVLFADLVGFTKLVNSIDVYQIKKLMNDYLAGMSDVIFAHGGTINKFIGDGILAIFGAPKESPSDVQAQDAVNCALAMQECLANLNKSWANELRVNSIKMRIGIHNGPVIIGNFGNERRTEYTAFGHTVNIAARIQSVCEPGRVFFSEEVGTFIRSVKIINQGRFRLKGTSEDKELFSIENRDRKIIYQAS